MAKFIEVTTIKGVQVLVNTEHIKMVERLAAIHNMDEKTLLSTTSQELPRLIITDDYNNVKKFLTT